MPVVSSAVADRKAVARSRVTNGADMLPNTDGRSAVVRRFQDITSAILNDQPEHCSEARLQLVRRFAAAACLAELMEARLANGEQIDLPSMRFCPLHYVGWRSASESIGG